MGAKGFLVLKLSKTIHVTGFTIEHLPKSLSEDGHIRSAPKDFSIWVSILNIIKLMKLTPILFLLLGTET